MSSDRGLNLFSFGLHDRVIVHVGDLPILNGRNQCFC